MLIFVCKSERFHDVVMYTLPCHPSQCNLVDWQKQQCQHPKHHRRYRLVVHVIAVCNEAKYHHRNKANQHIVPIRHWCQAHQHQDCKDEINLFHSYLLYVNLIVLYTFQTHRIPFLLENLHMIHKKNNPC